MQRWLRFLPYLVESGYEVHVLSPQDGDFPVRDESLLLRVPKQVRIHHTRTPKSSIWWKMLLGKNAKLPHGNLTLSPKDGFLKKLLLWLRLNFIFPDLRVFWLPHARAEALKLHKAHSFDIIISTGPPHSAHLLPLWLKKRFPKLFWVADWRDPWSQIYYLQLQKPMLHARYIQRYLQNKVCRRADLNLVISQHLLEQLPKSNKLLLRNGFDAEQINNAKAQARVSENSFVISYVGQITMGQELIPLLSVLEVLADKSKLKIRFIGSNLSDEIIEQIPPKLKDRFEVLAFLPHEKALQEMASSRLLLLLINRYEGHQGMLTTKLYEYLGMGVKILAFGPRAGEAEELIHKYQAGACFDVDEIANAQKWLIKQYQRFEAGEKHLPLSEIRELSSEIQAEILIQALKKQRSISI